MSLKLAREFQLVYKDVKSLAMSKKVRIIKQSDFDSKFGMDLSNSGNKLFSTEDIDGIPYILCSGVLSTGTNQYESYNDLQFNTMTFITDIVDIYSSGLHKLITKQLIVCDETFQLLPMQLYYMETAQPIVIPGPFTNNTDYTINEYSIIIWNLKAITRFGT